jgi:DNA-binding PadR family transcriptional regulator
VRIHHLYTFCIYILLIELSRYCIWCIRTKTLNPASLDIISLIMELKINERAVLKLVDAGNDYGPDLARMVKEKLDCETRTAYEAIKNTQALGWISSEVLPGRGAPKRFSVTDEGRLELEKKSAVAIGRARWNARRTARRERIDNLPIWKTHIKGICLNCANLTHGDYPYSRWWAPLFEEDRFCPGCGSPMTWHPNVRDDVEMMLNHYKERRLKREAEEARVLEEASSPGWIPSKDHFAPLGTHASFCRCAVCEVKRERFEALRAETWGRASE